MTPAAHEPRKDHAGAPGPTLPNRRDLLKAGAAALAMGTVRLRLPAAAAAQEAASPTADLCLLTPE